MVIFVIDKKSMGLTKTKKCSYYSFNFCYCSRLSYFQSVLITAPNVTQKGKQNVMMECARLVMEEMPTKFAKVKAS